jgi:protein TonB
VAAAAQGRPGEDPLAAIRERIVAARSYPEQARRRGWEGRVLVRFTVDARGEPRNLELLETSGFPVLDRATLRAVERGAPYPLLEGWITVPLVYRMEG